MTLVVEKPELFTVCTRLMRSSCIEQAVSGLPNHTALEMGGSTKSHQVTEILSVYSLAHVTFEMYVPGVVWLWRSNGLWLSQP